MSERVLLLRVTLHASLYHGHPDWPPSPARLYQAIVAAASARLDDPDVYSALQWLESQPAPIVAAPHAIGGQRVGFFVPNNDLDTQGGDPANVPKIRTAKEQRAQHLAHSEILYAWRVDDRAPFARISEIAEGLYQLGRGLDMASASAHSLAPEDLDDVLEQWVGPVHYPSLGAPGPGWLCPRPGTLESLRARHDGMLHRFQRVARGPVTSEVFRQPPRAAFVEVSYDAKARSALFDFHRSDDPGRFATVALIDAVSTVTRWRDAAAKRLKDAGVDPALVDDSIIGCRAGEGARSSPHSRVRLIPLPSIGHRHADEQIRRLLVSVPAGGPLRFKDVRWAFSGLSADGSVLVEADDPTMYRRYAELARVWATVTPIALPAARRRLDPGARRKTKEARERTLEEDSAVDAVFQALRHAQLYIRPRSVEVQREPFTAHGARVEAFETKPRFPKERLWHVRIDFGRRVSGPIVLGDGRFLGLGVMRPDREPARALLAFQIVDGLSGEIEPLALARHLRRAVLSRAQAEWGNRKLPPFITGHNDTGDPAQGHEHMHYIVDPVRSRLIVLQARPDNRLVRALESFAELRAGSMGVLELRHTAMLDDDPIVARASTWRSITPYRLQRHRRAASAAEAARLDLFDACKHLPISEVSVGAVQSVPGGVEASQIVLTFSRPVLGPLVIGKTRHFGGGLFERVS